MKRISKGIGPVVLVWLCALAAGHAEGTSPPTTAPEWEWLMEVHLPAGEKPARLVDFVLTPDVFDKAKSWTLDDLRFV